MLIGFMSICNKFNNGVAGTSCLSNDRDWQYGAIRFQPSGVQT